MSAWKRLALVWAAGLMLASFASANPLDAGRKVYTNKLVFSVPIRMDDADRAVVRSIKFYVKVPGGTWALQETATSQATKFTYTAKDDGEYLFTFATEDFQGRQAPVHPDQEPPKLVVVVDTKPPELSVKALPVASGQTYLQCAMRDANSDPESLRAEYQKESGEWTSLTPLGNSMHGVFRCPATGLPNRIRIIGRDRAGNQTNQMVMLANGAKSNHEIASAGVAPAAPLHELPAPVKADEPPATSVVATPALPRAVVPENKPNTQPVPNRPTVTQLLPRPVETQFPTMAVPEPRVTEKPSVMPINPAPAMNTAAAMNRQLINSRTLNLAYALDGISPNVVERVEAYATRDEGKTWFRLGEDIDRHSPISLAVPEDGVYGIIVMVSLAGRAGGPPAAGDQADWWIEVDATPPDVRLDSVQPGAGEDLGLVLLNWSVREKNPTPDSVEVSWSNNADGPWMTIAKGLRSDGTYKWPSPREAGSRVYLKIESTDRAGNVGKFVTPQPVLIEGARPRARVIGINPSAVGVRQ